MIEEDDLGQEENEFDGSLDNDTLFIDQINSINPNIYEDMKCISGLDCPKEVYRYLKIHSLSSAFHAAIESETTSLYKYLLLISETTKMFKLKNLNVPEVAILMVFLLAHNPKEAKCNEFSEVARKFFGYFGANRSFKALVSKGLLCAELDEDDERYYYLAPDVVKELQATLQLSNITSKIKEKKTTDLFEVESKPKEFHSNSRYIIPNEKLKVQKLIYEQSVSESLTKVADILDPIKFEDIQKRLSKRNTGSSICISLYGESGTGKTESVFQLARNSGRDLFNYVISESESQWAGAQSSAIHKMFEEYNTLCKEYETAKKPIPILLLNEADAVFGKRTDNPNSGYEKELNHLQAELLNHMDDFKGIMFITTNVFDGFDDAFNRRFLFKIKFNNPDKETQKKIWKLNFKHLSKDDINVLVDRFNMTGGNISNVKKKMDINYIIYGTDPNLNDLVSACKSEREETVQKHIGFTS